MPALRSSKLSWIRATVALMVLLSGFLSSGIDFLENHPAAVKQATGRYSETNGSSPVSHIEIYKSETAVPRCNACYFHKVVGQSLLAVNKLVVVAASSIQLTNHFPVLLSVATVASDGNRSPPAHTSRSL
jgi:hypothetical protein